MSLRVQAEVDGAATIVSTVVETGSLQLALSYPNEGNGELVTINVSSALDVPEPVTLALVGAALLGIATTGRRKPALPCPLTSQPAFVGSPRCGGAAVAARNRRRDRHHRSARPAGGVERKLHRECSTEALGEHAARLSMFTAQATPKRECPPRLQLGLPAISAFATEAVIRPSRGEALRTILIDCWRAPSLPKKRGMPSAFFRYRTSTMSLPNSIVSRAHDKIVSKAVSSSHISFFSTS